MAPEGFQRAIGKPFGRARRRETYIRTAAALGLAPYFSGMVVSGEIGYDKPRPEIFEAALELAGHPGCCFFIGDNPVADGQGAADAGIPVLLVHIRENLRGFTAFETLTQVLHCIEGKI